MIFKTKKKVLIFDISFTPIVNTLVFIGVAVQNTSFHSVLEKNKEIGYEKNEI